jgi:hypothetical protein
VVDGFGIFPIWLATGIIYYSALHHGPAKDNLIPDHFLAADTSQISIREISLAKVCLIKRCTVEISPDKNCLDQCGSTEISPIQICATEISFCQVGP